MTLNAAKTPQVCVTSAPWRQHSAEAAYCQGSRGRGELVPLLHAAACGTGTGTETGAGQAIQRG